MRVPSCNLTPCESSPFQATPTARERAFSINSPIRPLLESSKMGQIIPILQPLVLVLVLLPVLIWPEVAAAEEGRAKIDTPPPSQQEATKPFSYGQLLRRLQTFFTIPKGSSFTTTPTMTTSFTPGDSTKPSLSQPFPVLGGRKDTWAAQSDLQIISRLLDGDHHNLLAELIQVCDLHIKQSCTSFMRIPYQPKFDPFTHFSHTHTRPVSGKRPRHHLAGSCSLLPSSARQSHL